MEESTLNYDWVLPSEKLLNNFPNERASPIFPDQLDRNAKKNKHLWVIKLVVTKRKQPTVRSMTIDICLCLAWAESEYYFFTEFELEFKFSSSGEWSNIKKIRKHLFHITFNTDMIERNFISLTATDDPHNYKSFGPFQISCRMKIKAENCIIPTNPKEILEFEGLLENSQFSDFTVSTVSKEFKVHKCILAIRSEVFAAMFRNNMKEKEEGFVKITDFDDEVVTEFLRYMYCGKVENLAKLSKNLLLAAEKYSVEGLKALCIEEMCKQISILDAVELLSLADRFKVDHLKPYIINFIIINVKEIDESHFKLLDNFRLMQEIFLKIKNHIL